MLNLIRLILPEFQLLQLGRLLFAGRQDGVAPKQVTDTGIKLFIFTGKMAYLILMAWMMIGVWFFIIATYRDSYLMAATGLPVSAPSVSNILLIWCGLATWYLYASPTVASMFRSTLFLKPMMLMALIHFAGMMVVYNILFSLCNTLTEPASTLWLYMILATGIVTTRIVMSLFFTRYPAEWLAQY